jgi:hypothetical protein
VATIGVIERDAAAAALVRRLMERVEGVSQVRWHGSAQAAVSGIVQPNPDVVLVGFGRKTRCLGGVRGEAGEPSLGEANAALAGIEVSLWLRHYWSEVAQNRRV